MLVSNNLTEIKDPKKRKTYDRKIYDRKYRETHKNLIKEQNRRWRQNNIERVRISCRRNSRVDYYKKKEFLDLYKTSKGCIRCGIIDFRCLELHHRNPETKDGRRETRGAVKMSGSWEHIKDELIKCDVICANCHRILHTEERKLKNA